MPDEPALDRAARRAEARHARRKVHTRRRFTLAAALVALVAFGAYLESGSGGSSVRSASSSGRGSSADVPAATPAKPAPPPPPALVVHAPRSTSAKWTLAARVHGRPAVWVAQHGGVTLLRMDQSQVHLTLHAGSADGGEAGWVYGDKITPAEIHHLVAAFNGGFKLTYARTGFKSGSHVAAALQSGLASIITYTDGSTNIGSWNAGVPSARKSVYSVLQNQSLLIDHGVAASTASSCIIECWGATIGGRTSVARSAIGITSSGQLLWAAGENLVPSELASAMISAGVLRAVQLDINPDWVSGYLYEHHPPAPTAAQLVPGQLGIAGRFLEPYSRDFLAVIANR